MVKIPSSTRREQSADVDTNRTATDETRTTQRLDGVDGADRPTLSARWADRDRSRVSDPPTGHATPVAPTAPAGPNAPTDAERRLAGTDLTTGTRPPGTRPDGPDTGDLPGPTADVVPPGPRPRTSVLATLSLIFAMAGAFFVLSGALAGYGIGVGAVGFVLAVSAFAATRQRHVGGKLDATLGLLIGGAAVVVGVLAFTGAFSWPNTDGDWVERLRGWLDTQSVDRF